ncbi:hypothetical protein [Nocardioides sp.]|uniref:hypothetical protein n=1 Tax=Nocardioides sp. TaxID=35761 RepID=UPI0031FE450E|nr:hypothetical protein [Nocardioides sp.]
MTRSSDRTRRPLAAIISAGCLVGITAASTAAPAPAATAPRASKAAACGWKVVAAPSPGIGSVTLRGIDAITRSDIWAVGARGAQGATLAQHWNGHGWAVVKTPNRSKYTQLEDVTAISHKNVWAVGWFVPKGGKHPKSLIEHWNGDHWSVVPSPNPLKGNNVLFGVDGKSAKAVYAVGTNNLGPSAGSRQITLKLGSGKWRALPVPSGSSTVDDVATLSVGQAVAVGHAGPTGSSAALVEQFDGSDWVGLPVATTTNSGHLYGVSAPSAGGQWAVGSSSGAAALQTLTVQKTATGWEELASPNTSTTLINVLTGVVGLSESEAWAVGYHEDSTFYTRTLVEHFSSGAWSIVASPNVGAGHNQLLDITAANGDLWAVGYSTRPTGTKVLIESRRC